MSQAPIFTPGAWLQIGIAQAHTPGSIGDIGLASDAVRLAIQLAFENTPAKRVIGVTDARNDASIGLLDEVGMRRVETKAAVFRGEACVDLVYAFVREAC
jgi:RimJ/RimL family protein N-acetyltransferase